MTTMERDYLRSIRDKLDLLLAELDEPVGLRQVPHDPTPVAVVPFAEVVEDEIPWAEAVDDRETVQLGGQLWTMLIPVPGHEQETDLPVGPATVCIHPRFAEVTDDPMPVEV
jgi:hypothetical protein